ncbi:MAG: 5-formyltetrahydrofolate cyclo-ligase [Bacteroidetes bacterium]|nr:5-formyltetrahydrofolate cyclo-ligase [Bacteroidota bacterium]
MTKKEARTYFREKRAALSGDVQLEMLDKMLVQFKAFSFPPIHYLHTYLPMPSSNEIDTEAFITQLSLANADIQVCVPVTQKSTDTLINALWKPGEPMMLNHYGIPEPKEVKEIDPKQIDLVFVPLLAFDEQGYRVGYGKGYYDRFLPECRKDTLFIGLSFFLAITNISDRQHFDIPLDLCITPERIYEFG